MTLRGRLPSLGILAGVVVLDQLTKWWVRQSLDLHEFRPIIDGLLSISHVENRGAAFGLFAEAGLPHQSLLFSIISMIALAAIAVYAFRLPREARLPRLALSLVLGGAVGNLIDRLRLGHVVDFVHVYWKHHQWPDFNAADSAISIGVALLILDMLRTADHADQPQSEIAGIATHTGRTD